MDFKIELTMIAVGVGQCIKSIVIGATYNAALGHSIRPLLILSYFITLNELLYFYKAKKETLLAGSRHLVSSIKVKLMSMLFFAGMKPDCAFHLTASMILA